MHKSSIVIALGTIFIGITYSCKNRVKNTNANLVEVKNGAFIITCQHVDEINAWITRTAPKLIDEEPNGSTTITPNLDRRFCVHRVPSNQSAKEGLEIVFADVSVESGQGVDKSDAGVACDHLKSLKFSGKNSWTLPKSINANAEPKEVKENISLESIVTYLNKIKVKRVNLTFWSNSIDKTTGYRRWFVSDSGNIENYATGSGSTLGLICINDPSIETKINLLQK